MCNIKTYFSYFFRNCSDIIKLIITISRAFFSAYTLKGPKREIFVAGIFSKSGLYGLVT